MRYTAVWCSQSAANVASHFSQRGSLTINGGEPAIGRTAITAELAGQGIRVSLVCPGFVDTPMHHRGRGILGDDIYDKNIFPRVHTRRAGRPEEISRSIVFLCSDASSYISVATVTPNGAMIGRSETK